VLDCSLYVQLFYDLYYRHNRMNNTKVIAGQAKSVNSYTNIKTKLLKCCANTYFNTGCVRLFFVSTIILRLVLQAQRDGQYKSSTHKAK
jgi:hypothetical protein